jgi:uncharacterized DUF497 family protein
MEKSHIRIGDVYEPSTSKRSARFYETVFGGRILSRGDRSGAPAYIQIANTWLIVNGGGGPTPNKPSVTLSVPTDPDSVSSFMNIRVADIQACYELWRNRGAEFITEPKDKYGETRCYIRDPGVMEIAARTSDEPRWLLIGQIDQKHWSAIITRRGENIRLISVRRSRDEEVALYESEDI